MARGYVGGQGQKDFSLLGTKLYFRYFHVNSLRKNSIVLTPKAPWPPFLFGCKLRIDLYCSTPYIMLKSSYLLFTSVGTWSWLNKMTHHLFRLKSVLIMYSFKKLKSCMLGETKSWADIPETFLLKEYHKHIPIKSRSVFSQLKKWKTKLCFPWFRNDAYSRLMVHLFTNRFCAHSSKMPINHVESAMKCFTAAVHNPQIQRNKWRISIFWGYLSSWSGTEDGTEAWGRELRRSFKLLL